MVETEECPTTPKTPRSSSRNWTSNLKKAKSMKPPSPTKASPTRSRSTQKNRNSNDPPAHVMSTPKSRKPSYSTKKWDDGGQSCSTRTSRSSKTPLTPTTHTTSTSLTAPSTVLSPSTSHTAKEDGSTLATPTRSKSRSRKVSIPASALNSPSKHDKRRKSKGDRINSMMISEHSKNELSTNYTAGNDSEQNFASNTPVHPQHDEQNRSGHPEEHEEKKKKKNSTIYKVKVKKKKSKKDDDDVGDVADDMKVKKKKKKAFHDSIRSTNHKDEDDDFGFDLDLRDSNELGTRRSVERSKSSRSHSLPQKKKKRDKSVRSSIPIEDIVNKLKIDVKQREKQKNKDQEMEDEEENNKSCCKSRRTSNETKGENVADILAAAEEAAKPTTDKESSAGTSVSSPGGPPMVIEIEFNDDDCSVITTPKQIREEDDEGYSKSTSKSCSTVTSTTATSTKQKKRHRVPLEPDGVHHTEKLDRVKSLQQRITTSQHSQNNAPTAQQQARTSNQNRSSVIGSPSQSQLKNQSGATVEEDAVPVPTSKKVQQQAENSLAANTKTGSALKTSCPPALAAARELIQQRKEEEKRKLQQQMEEQRRKTEEAAAKTSSSDSQDKEYKISQPELLTSNKSSRLVVLVLVSNMSMNRAVLARQQRAITILDSMNNVYDDTIAYRLLDGTDPNNREKRNQLHQMSGRSGPIEYPQFFTAYVHREELESISKQGKHWELLTVDTTELLSYKGDAGWLESTHETGELRKELMIE